MWLLAIAGIIVIAAVILNFFVKWLNSRRKSKLLAEQKAADEQKLLEKEQELDAQGRVMHR